MLLTGKRVRAAQAYRHGLVDALTSPGGLVETAAKAALGLAERDAEAEPGQAAPHREAARPPAAARLGPRQGAQAR